jgi:hypothetical protein
MKPLPQNRRTEIGRHLQDARVSHSQAVALLAHPEGHPPERLEDALNALADAGFQARRAYRAPEEVA